MSLADLAINVPLSSRLIQSLTPCPDRGIEMTPAYYILLLLSLLTIALGIPVPEDDETNSVGQHLGHAGLWLFGGLAGIGMAMGCITYGTSWLHRFKSMQAEFAANTTTWDAEQARKEQEHEKHMEALDIILDVAKNYTESVGKISKEFDPFEVIKEMQDDVEDAKIKAET